MINHHDGLVMEQNFNNPNGARFGGLVNNNTQQDEFDNGKQ